jgi:hypothetical protein
MSLMRLTFFKDTLGSRRSFDASTVFSVRNRKIAAADVGIAKTRPLMTATARLARL